jgi:hypothetical protein
MKIESIAFSPNPKLSPLNSKEQYLCEELKAWIQYGQAELWQWTLPKGFITDLRSGPSIVNPVLPKWGADSCQCVLILLHDYNYCAGAKRIFARSIGDPVAGLKPDEKYSVCKKDADYLLVEGLRWAGHPSWKCAAVRMGLSIAGASRFGKDKIRIWDERKQEVRICEER